MTIIGSYNKTTGTFRMQAPTFPYDSTTYVGYTLTAMKKKYRKQHKLQGKHLDWWILGLD